MERFWVYLDNKVQGPVDIPSLRKFPGFSLLTQVCLEGQETWRVADEVIEIKSYFSSPPRFSSITETQPELPISNALQSEIPITLDVVPAESSLKAQGALIETLPGQEAAAVALSESPAEHPLPSAESTPASQTLRKPCDVCGYKNPRDVNVCMKCGEPLKPAAAVAEAEKPKNTDDLIDLPVNASTPSPLIDAIKIPLTATEPAAAAAPAIAHAMPDIPVNRIMTMLAAATLIIMGGLVGNRLWKKHKTHIPVKMASAPAVAPMPAVITPSVPSIIRHQLPGMRGRHSHGARSSHKPHIRPSGISAAAMPGISQSHGNHSLLRTTERTDAGASQGTEEDTPYQVLEAAAPLKQRHSSELNSRYAQKARGNAGLWAGKEDEAIQLVQRHRIYGGQRTILRNTEILMQILRDREYTTAFDSGKRLRLYNDMDWAAVPEKGPIYQVHLTFSGGKEVDGSPRKPLRFSFDVDMERETIEPGGKEIEAENAMHAFFDESRIPPEERRDIAKDTEELVLAAQPEASPLALDTVSRQFVNTYSQAALERVARAFELDNLLRMAQHTPRMAKSEESGQTSSKDSGSSFSSPMAPESKKNAKKTILTSTSGAFDITLEKGEGREHSLAARVPSTASMEHFWQTMTAYDRFTQFMPDVLVSDREGQDGAATIIHTVSLTRFMFFIFKMNLHLRIVEHPEEHTVEFERIAGDFETFRGSLQLSKDEASNKTVLNFNLAFAPRSYIPMWILNGMVHRFVQPSLEALRAQAEAQ